MSKKVEPLKVGDKVYTFNFRTYIPIEDIHEDSYIITQIYKKDYWTYIDIKNDKNVIHLDSIRNEEFLYEDNNYIFASYYEDRDSRYGEVFCLSRDRLTARKQAYFSAVKKNKDYLKDIEDAIKKLKQEYKNV
jgi:hypothetical protein